MCLMCLLVMLLVVYGLHVRLRGGEARAECVALCPEALLNNKNNNNNNNDNGNSCNMYVYIYIYTYIHTYIHT